MEETLSINITLDTSTGELILMGLSKDELFLETVKNFNTHTREIKIELDSDKLVSIRLKHNDDDELYFDYEYRDLIEDEKMHIKQKADEKVKHIEQSSGLKDELIKQDIKIKELENEIEQLKALIDSTPVKLNKVANPYNGNETISLQKFQPELKEENLKLDNTIKKRFFSWLELMGLSKDEIEKIKQDLENR